MGAVWYRFCAAQTGPNSNPNIRNFARVEVPLSCVNSIPHRLGLALAPAK
jgi:hypothetical protein